MLNKILGYFSYDLGIDLGTANTLVAIKDKGIVINEPSVVALHKKTREILAVGEEAKKMVGKTPENIVAVRPLKDGVISDIEATEKMLSYFIKQVHKEGSGLPKIPRPRTIIGVPSGITEVEQRAVLRASQKAGSRKTYLVEEAMAAALGIDLKVDSPEGNLVIDIGGGTTEIALISLGGIVLSKSLKIGGDKFDEDIVNYVKSQYKVLIGTRRAEEAKKSIGDVSQLLSLLGDTVESINKGVSSGNTVKKSKKYPVRGRSLKTGLPELINLTPQDISLALKDTVFSITDTLKVILEDMPPELVSDVLKNGIYLVGGGSKIEGLADLISHQVGVKVHTSEKSEFAVVKGTIKLLDNISFLERVSL